MAQIDLLVAMKLRASKRGRRIWPMRIARRLFQATAKVPTPGKPKSSAVSRLQNARKAPLCRRTKYFLTAIFFLGHNRFLTGLSILTAVIWVNQHYARWIW
jgi:hypothetical protein